MNKVVIGIDIGGTFTKYGFVTESGDVYNEGSVPTDKHARAEDFIKELCSFLQKIRDKHSYELMGIGIGAPNGNFYSGNIENAANLKWKGVIRLSEMFRKYFSLPVTITNDANAAALGELIYGNGRGVDDFLMITLGTGLGSGLVVNGKLVYGHDGFAGELGHTTSVIDGRQCGCGKRGCLETYVSATGLKRTLYEMISSENDPSKLRGIAFDDLTPKMVYDAALEGDVLALKTFDFTGKMLGYKLADAVAHTSPEIIVLFGGLALAGDLIFEPTRRYMEENLVPVFRNKIKIIPSALQDKNIAVLGAAALIWHELKKSSQKVI